MDKKTFKASGLIEKYMLGLTDESEDRIVEEFMASDEDIKRQIFECQDSLHEKSKEFAKPTLSATKTNISKQFNNLDDAYGNESTGIGKWVQYAAIFLLSCSTLYFWNGNQSLKAETMEMAHELNIYQESIAYMNREKATLTSNEYILTHSATERVQLRGTNLSPEASLLAFYNPTAEVLMIKINKLPPPPAGKYYHMWADVDGEMIHVGSLSNDAVRLTSLKYVSGAESLNVTIEDLSEVDLPDTSQLALSGLM